MFNFDAYAFSKQPDFNEAATRKAFKKAVPLKTVVVYCYDPRAVGVPSAVAKALNCEVFPGEIITDANGNKIASSTTIFPVIVAGGRAADALRSITVAQHLFGIENIAVVHHSHCGATSFTADGIINAYKHEHHVDISGLYERENICIEDYVSSLHRDVGIVRNSKGTPRYANVYGFFYDIDSERLTLVVEDRGSSSDRPTTTDSRQAAAEHQTTRPQRTETTLASGTV